MTEQVWDFAAIEGGASEIQAAVGTTHNLLDEGKGSLASLAAVWGGAGSEAYQGVQMRWDTTSAELNTALQQLGQAVVEAGSTMGTTEGKVMGMFGG